MSCIEFVWLFQYSTPARKTQGIFHKQTDMPRKRRPPRGALCHPFNRKRLFPCPAAQEPTSNKKPPLPRRNPQGGKKTAPAAPGRDSITQPIQNCKKFSSYIRKYKRHNAPPPQENSCGGGHSDTFLRVRKQLSVIPSAAEGSEPNVLKVIYSQSATQTAYS